tara:strand:- start:186 stop:575 length:390 start_codon:yes stop_codon:yes gene_type:complete
MITEASTKANKLHVMHAAKQIGKIKDNEERERQVKDLENKAKKMGLNRADVERMLDKQGAYGEEYEMKKSMEEAENMHNYINTLSLDRSVNLGQRHQKKMKILIQLKVVRLLLRKHKIKLRLILWKKKH